jgi:hypothetical protein
VNLETAWEGLVVGGVLTLFVVTVFAMMAHC